MDEEKFIIIKNIEHYQHYRDRKIVWLKLHISILQDYAFMQLNNAERWFFLGLLMLAARNNNAIPVQPSYIKQQLLNGRIPFDKTIEKMEKSGLIAIKPLSECYQADSSIRREEKREDEIRKEDTFSFDKSSNKELELEERLKDWNDRQSSPMVNFEPVNIIRKYGADRVESLLKEYGSVNGGFSLFMRSLKNKYN